VPRTRPPYPGEFRREAIGLALLGDKPRRRLAKDLGISDVTLRNWLKRAAPPEAGSRKISTFGVLAEGNAALPAAAVGRV
jgi:transposase